MEVADMPNENKKPVFTKRAGSLSVTCWKNTAVKDGKEFDNYSFVVTRGYKDGEEWKNTSSLRINDLPKIKILLNEAYKEIILSEKED